MNSGQAIPFDEEKVRKSWNSLSEQGEIRELRILNHQPNNKTSFSQTTSGYFDNADAVIESLNSLKGSAPSVYLTLNPVSPELMARASNRLIERAKNTSSDTDIVCRGWLLIDIDPQRPAGISSSDEEKEGAREIALEVIKYLQDEGIDRLVTADSGNGYHILIPINLPNDGESTDLCKRFLGNLARTFDTETTKIDQGVFNSARILKLYGTLVAKGENHPDRPHRMSMLRKVLGDVKKPIPKETLLKIAGDSELKPLPSNYHSSCFTLLGFMSRHGILGKPKKMAEYRESYLIECPFNPEHGKSGEVFVGQRNTGEFCFQCKHNSCQEHSWKDFRVHYEHQYTERNNSLASRASVAQANSHLVHKLPIDTYQPDAWPKPGNPFSRTVPMAFPIDVLPKSIADYVIDQSSRMGADVGMLAMFSLVCCASAITDEIKIQPKINDPSWQESARLWVAAVGNPSIKKTPSLNAVAIPVWNQDEKWRKEEQKFRRKFELEKKIYSKKETAYIKAVAEDKTDVVEPVPPESPEIHRAVVDDITVEALGNILSNTKKGVLLHADELSGFFGGMDAYRERGVNKDRAHYLQLYNGGDRRIDRVSRGSILVSNWGASIIGGIQPGPMARIAKNMNDDGLLQRFNVFIASDSVEGHNVTRDQDAFNKYSELIRGLYEIIPSAQPVVLSDEAEQVRKRMERRVVDVQKINVLPLGLRTHIGKFEGMFARYCLLFHVLEQRECREHPTAKPVSGEVAERVEKLLVSYLMSHAMAFYRDVVGNNDVADLAGWIARFILAKELAELTRRDLKRRVAQAKNSTAWELHIAMDALAILGWVIPNDDTRPHGKWLVNPDVHDVFKEMSAEEKGRRAREYEQLQELFSQMRSQVGEE